MNSLPRCFRLAFLVTLLCLVAEGPSIHAQKQQPGQPNPQAPNLKQPAPLGMQRGTTLDLTLTGTNLADPVALWTSFPCKATFPKENNNGKDAAKLVVRLEVPADAPLGFHAIRLASTRGVSNLRLFCIDDLPQVLQADTNRNKSTPQPIKQPCVVVGRAQNEASDWYKITAKAGERVSFEVLGRQLGSVFDPQLTLYDARTGRELSGGHANDAPPQVDPRLSYTFKDAGDYLVEIRDVSYRGGDDFYYRLRVGDFPLASSPIPLAAKRGTKSRVEFVGPAADGVPALEVEVPSDPNATSVSVTPKGANGQNGWPVTLAVSDLDEAVEQEPNDEPSKANRVPVPGAITARFAKAKDLDHFVFTAKKEQRLIIDAQALEWNSPTEVYIVVRDAKGGELAKSNLAVGAKVDFKAPADGDYTAAVEHIHLWGGPGEVYRLTITPYEPSFDLTLQLDRFDLPRTGTVAIPILVARRDYTGPIEVSVSGPAGLTGQVTIAAGQPAQPNQPGGTLTLRATEEVPLGPAFIRLVGKASINGKEFKTQASVRPVISQALGGLPLPPHAFNNVIAVGVLERPPFALTAKLAAPEVMPGKSVMLTVMATRQAGFGSDIALSVTGLPANVTAQAKPILGKGSEVTIEIKAANNAAPGTYPISVRGTGKHDGRDYAGTSPPVSLVIKK